MVYDGMMVSLDYNGKYHGKHHGKYHGQDYGNYENNSLNHVIWYTRVIVQLSYSIIVIIWFLMIIPIFDHGICKYITIMV